MPVVEWVRTYPDGFKGKEFYETLVNGYKLQVKVLISGKGWRWVLLADPAGRYPIKAGREHTLKQAQQIAVLNANSLAPGNHVTNLLPSELSLEANKKDNGPT